MQSQSMTSGIHLPVYYKRVSPTNISLTICVSLFTLNLATYVEYFLIHYFQIETCVYVCICV
jgi:hypothetical protein